MPIFFQQDIDSTTRLGIWKIEEEEAFFRQRVAPQRDVTHMHKRLQHLAGRYLLTYLFPDFPTSLIQIADTRKPFLENEAYHFSISHCGQYAAALVSQTKRVGVDIELSTPKVQKIKHKFLGGDELKLLHEQGASGTGLAHPISLSNDLLILLWSCKETVFKWYGWGEVDFKEHMVLKKIKQLTGNRYETVFCFKKNDHQLLELSSWFLPVPASSIHPATHMALSYVAT